MLRATPCGGLARGGPPVAAGRHAKHRHGKGHARVKGTVPSWPVTRQRAQAVLGAAVGAASGRRAHWQGGSWPLPAAVHQGATTHSCICLVGYHWLDGPRTTTAGAQHCQPCQCAENRHWDLMVVCAVGTWRRPRICGCYPGCYGTPGGWHFMHATTVGRRTFTLHSLHWQVRTCSGVNGVQGCARPARGPRPRPRARPLPGPAAPALRLPMDPAAPTTCGALTPHDPLPATGPGAIARVRPWHPHPHRGGGG